jgi:hypothetical protein
MSAARQANAKLTAEAEQVASRALAEQSRSWKDMVRSTASVSANIIGATRSLLKWTALTSVFSGLLGAGGLFGIERLAQSAAGQRRSAAGLGVTPGEERAFGLNYGRLVDTGSMLHGVNASLTDASQRGNLYRAGLSESDIAGKDAAQVSVALIGKLKTLADKTPSQLLGNIVTAYGLGSLGITAEDLQRIKNRPAGEIAGYGRDFSKDQKGLDLTPGQQGAWENFKVQLDRAGTQIEQTFIKNLTPLTPELGRLSAAFSGLVDKLLGGDAGKGLITSIASGLGSFATTVSSKEFQDGVVSFVDDIGRLAKAIHAAIGWMFSKNGPTPGRDEGGNLIGPPEAGADPDAQVKRFWNWLKNNAPTGGGENGISPLSYPGGGVSGLVHQIAYRPGGAVGGQFGGIEAANGLPGGLLDSVWNAESGRGKNPGPSKAGAEGDFQFMPGTWGKYGGGGSPWNLADSSAAAGRYLGKLVSQFHGDIAKAVAGYNWGEGNVEKDVARWGADWQAHLPKETQGYLRKVLPGVGIDPPRGQQWAVNIFNNTGGSAVVVARALG